MATGLLVLAACGGNSPYGSSGGSPGRSSPGATSQQSSGASSVIKVAQTDLGRVLATAGGRVVYLLTSDTSDTTTCTGGCLKTWPPVTVSGTPRAAGVAAAMGSLSRRDGTKQLTIAGHPAYTYAGDTSPGQTNGEGITSFGGTWWALSPAGTAVTGSAGGGGSPTSGGNGSPSGGARGY